jgi:flotillin
MSTINEQTGIVLPEWQFGKLGNQLSEREVNGKAITGMNSAAPQTPSTVSKAKN